MPTGYQYENKEYIYESKCKHPITMRCMYLITYCHKMRRSQRTMAKELVCALIYCATGSCRDSYYAGTSKADRLGLGEPSEDPYVHPTTMGSTCSQATNSLFVDIVAPRNISATSKYPVKVYIHGGYVLLRPLRLIHASHIFTAGSCSSARRTD